MDYRDPETARRRSIFHQRIQIGFPGRSFVVDLQSYFSSLLGGHRQFHCWRDTAERHVGALMVVRP
ncbi:hypothetical protein DGN07_23620 (plasmid) [Xanthomonas citri pv. fuscans]|nr:hypothetical protein DGN07_23620 [Xanthomonas citri pv. fuscans]